MRQDPERLAQLRRLLVLDTSPERRYDDIARLLSSTFDVPITMINLLDSQRDWFKACVGMPLTESPAVTSFCEQFFHTSENVIVVDDTRLDGRFADHPMVVGEPFVRFYAAARLVVGGHTVGTVCAYDFKPRTVTPAQRSQLETLADAAAAALAGPVSLIAEPGELPITGPGERPITEVGDRPITEHGDRRS